ncbi:arylesterase [Labrys sp. KB_33_2]|uniref:arylesterase n=1 Tax=Labrys sp. KB_33_2 TaxID=3237479 RepID=UPI003F92AA57
MTPLTSVSAAAEPLRLVALGDSLTAGLGLEAKDAYPAKLQAALAKLGVEVVIDNAGVSGDTTDGGLARLDWSVPDGTKAVLIELGANDMLRGLDPKLARANLAAMLERLKERKIPVLLMGMRAAPNLGADYQKAFDAVYPDLASQYGAVLYPFFLDGVAGTPGLNQADGMHPTAAGVDVIVTRLAPVVAEFVRKLR